MNSSIFVILSVLVLAAFTQDTKIECFQRTHNDSKTETCLGKYCYKIEGKDSKGSSFTKLGCMPELDKHSQVDNCTVKKEPNINFDSIMCICTKRLCNASSSNFMSSIITLMSLMFLSHQWFSTL